MNGEELKKIVKTCDVSINNIAKSVGVSPQVISQTFNSPDVKSGLLENILKACGLSMVDVYGGKTSSVTNTINTIKNSQVATGDGASVSGTSDDMLGRMLDELKAQRQQNDKLIELLAQQLSK